MPCGECRQDFDPLCLRGALPEHVLAVSKGLNINDPASSEELSKAGFKPPVTKSRQDVAIEAQRRSQTLLASYHLLRNIIERHEAVIQKRWMSKTRQKRIEILEAAWPGMATIHRADFDIFYREQLKHQYDVHEISPTHREQFMWPHINQEDLSKPRPLLLLINARGRRHPSEFAAVDNEAMQLGKATKAIVPIFLDGHVMVLNGITENEEYGKLLNQNDHSQVAEWMKPGRQMDPGEGLLVLEAQEHLLDFLVKCCQNLLHEIPPENLTLDMYPVQPATQLKTERNANGFASLAALAADAPYTTPSQFDLNRIESLLCAQVSAIEDHVLALREDPAYFAQEISDIKEHHCQVQHWPLGTRARSTCGLKCKVQVWNEIIGALVLDAYYDHEVYSELWRQAKHLQLMHVKYYTQINTANDLPVEFETKLLSFFYSLTRAAQEPLCELYHEFYASPPMRKLVSSRRHMKVSRFQNKLIWLLNVLGEDSRHLAFIGLTAVVDELERSLQADPRMQELISSRIASSLGKISIVAQCLNQIETYRPWSAIFRNRLVRDYERLALEFPSNLEPLKLLIGAIPLTRLRNIAQLRKIIEGKFSYPAGKRRTRANVEAMQNAEKDLDEFWASADSLLDGTNLKIFKSLDLQNRTWQRTPDWIETPPSRRVSNNKSPDAQDLDQCLLPFSININRQQEEINPKLDLLQPKFKVKTKVKTKGTPYTIAPIAQTADDDVADIHAKVELLTESVKIQADSRALKVFRALFFNPEVTCTTGEVSWSDFLHAMISIGFTAEKLYGSAWQFQSGDSNRTTIQFHEPHPRKKIPFNTARRHGRRLHRAFGWDSDTFVAKEKMKG